MSIIYMARSDSRQAFVSEVFRRLAIQDKAAGKRVLLKPNIVSHEPYPTTTHPEALETCIRLLSSTANTVVVADGPAWDGGDPKTIIENHPLKSVCEALGAGFRDLMENGTKMVRTPGYELEIAQEALECDFIISLPVLKVHSICGLTGALKNHVGFLSVAEKRRLHRDFDVHRTIAELHHVIKPDFYIVDAVTTLITTNEIRHGGKPRALGYMLAGTDPVSLDTAGLEILSKVETKLQNRRFSDIAHIRYAAEMGIGEPHYETVELEC